MLEAQDGINFIPNNFHLDRTSQTFQLITGPNMGGKSTYIRMAAVLQHMAQMGMFLPCKSATISLRCGLLPEGLGCLCLGNQFGSVLH